MSSNILTHEGRKYLKPIISCLRDNQSNLVIAHIDVYAILVAYNVTCPAIGHAIKKLLMPGQRDKGSKLNDLKGALAAINRAIELEECRELALPPATSVGV